MSAFVWVSMGHYALAQGLTTPPEPNVSVGFSFPITYNSDGEIVSGASTGVPALWGDVSVAVSERARLYLTVELPAVADVQARHPGSAGYLATYGHREIPILPMLGFRVSSVDRFRTLVVVGGGLVLWRTRTTYERFEFGSPTGFGTPEISTNNSAALALSGGVEFETTISERAVFVARFLARYSWGGGGTAYIGYFGPLGFSPGIGLRLRP